MAPQSLKNPRQAWSVLIVSTLAFTVCFMVWMMFGVIGIPIKKTLGLNATEFGLLTAMPVLSGSLIRVPLGIWTDKYGGRIVLAVLMAITVPAIYLMSYATAYWHFLVIGLVLGLAGGSFSVGTPMTPNIIQTMKQTVNASVLTSSTDHALRLCDGSTCAAARCFGWAAVLAMDAISPFVLDLCAHCSLKFAARPFAAGSSGRGRKEDGRLRLK